jgi:LytS/YehU family sensor histidine kinase
VVLYTVLHTTLLAVSRSIISPLVGLGHYDYGILSIRYLMEAGQDVVSYASFIAVLTLLRVHQRLQREQLHAAALARDAAEARLEALSLRLQPHFLFNALNTISSVVYDNPVAADTMIGHLGDLLRHALRTGNRAEISVAEELDVLRAYLAIVEARFGDRVQCDLAVDEAARSLAVPAFFLQPLVENAVRHGSAVEHAESRILVRITVDGASVRFVVENDIAAPTSTRGGSGTGLRTTAHRLRLLYADDQELAAGPTPDGRRFRVSARIPARPAPAAPSPAMAFLELAHAGPDR